MRKTSESVVGAIAAAAGLFTIVPVPAWAQAATTATAAKPRYAETYLWMPRQEPGESVREPLPIGDAQQWVRPEDYPADALAAGEMGQVALRVAVSAEGTITQCTLAQTDPRYGTKAAPPRLGELACRLIRERGRFLHALGKDGKPVATEVTIFVYFQYRETEEEMLAPPAPPAPPPGGYSYSPGLSLSEAPDWARYAPAGKPSGEVVIDVYVFTRSGAETRSCRVSRSSGDPALDKATCDAAQATGRFDRLRTWGGSMKLLVAWRKGKAKHELPRRDRGVPLDITHGDPQAPGLPPGSITRTAWVEAYFGADGRIRCRVLQTSGSDASDVGLCRHLQSLRYKPETDLFDRKVTVRRAYRFTP